LYEDNEFKVRIKYLPTWDFKIKRNPFDNSLVIFFPKDKKHFEAQGVKVAIRVEPLADFMSLNEYVESLEKEVLRDNEACKLITTSDHLILNASGKKIVFEFNRDSFSIRKAAFVTLRKKRAYVIFYEAKSEFFSNSEQLVEDMVSSFQDETYK
jgi:hypothetical protein